MALPTKAGLAICVPSSKRPVNIRWAISLTGLAYPVGMSVAWRVKEGTDRAENRNFLAHEAKKIGAEFILCLDDDTAIPAFAIRWLHAEMEKDPNIGVIGGIYCTKEDPPAPIVFKTLGGGPFYRWKIGEVFECAGIGTGCMLIRTSILDKIPEPWFYEPDEVFVDGEVTRATGTDDLYFCKKVSDAGFKIMAHGGVLPVHMNVDGSCFTLPLDSYPCQGANLAAWPEPSVDERIMKAAKITGWMELDELLWLARMAKKHKAIVEIGSFLGRSTRALADNTPGKVIAVDTFKASFESEPDTQLPNDLDRSKIFEIFMKNMKGIKNLTPMKMRSVKAAKKLKTQKKKFDMVFIDAGHNYEDVKADIKAWKPLLKPGGLLCGHDYEHPHFPGVTQAVEELLPGHRKGAGRIWYYFMPRKKL